ncbi:MAG: hypothetical protein HC893_03690, partial [Chloroflexaceae bacterium]|nr:hypothetical protein [Chloroflexaceae bacterium]
TSEGDFAAAQEQIEQVINEAAAGSDIDERARAALPAVYIGRAEEAMTAGDAATAFERLDFVLTNYQSGPGREAALASFATMAEPFYGQASATYYSGRICDCRRFTGRRDQLCARCPDCQPDSQRVAYPVSQLGCGGGSGGQL